jgi:mono/diheme cytochrome c family protein
MAHHKRHGPGLEVTVPLSAMMALLFFSLVLLSGCGSARRSEPIAGPMPMAGAGLTEGRKLFMRNCDQCHPRGEAGLAPALNNKPVPAFVTKLQVRHGLGAMPSFSKEEISDEDLGKIILYLEALRHHQ